MVVVSWGVVFSGQVFDMTKEDHIISIAADKLISQSNEYLQIRIEVGSGEPPEDLLLGIGRPQKGLDDRDWR